MTRKKPELLTNRFNNINNTENQRFYLNSRVYSKSGNKLGRIKEVIIKGTEMIGFLVKGKHKFFIDKDYVNSESEKAIMLSIDPVIELKGKQVFDSEGKKIGKVIALERKNHSNSFLKIIVRKNPFSKPFTIPKEDIEVFKENVILNKTY